jgi:hypothetical protein
LINSSLFAFVDCCPTINILLYYLCSILLAFKH